jgi:Zn-finger nucleic acid-binding protein
MPCPVCATGLVPNERQGIEIDFCPTCRGVWLDRGELDKIIERSAQAFAPQPQAPPAQPVSPGGAWPGHHGNHGQYQKKRRKSFFEELFD